MEKQEIILYIQNYYSLAENNRYLTYKYLHMELYDNYNIRLMTDIDELLNIKNVVVFLFLENNHTLDKTKLDILEKINNIEIIELNKLDLINIKELSNYLFKHLNHDIKYVNLFKFLDNYKKEDYYINNYIDIYTNSLIFYNNGYILYKKHSNNTIYLLYKYIEENYNNLSNVELLDKYIEENVIEKSHTLKQFIKTYNIYFNSIIEQLYGYIIFHSLNYVKHKDICYILPVYNNFINKAEIIITIWLLVVRCYKIILYNDNNTLYIITNLSNTDNIDINYLVEYFNIKVNNYVVKEFNYENKEFRVKKIT